MKKSLQQIHNPDYSLAKYFTDYGDYKQFYSRNEHYGLLCFLSKQFTNDTLYDIGTYRGLSSVALSLEKSNRVISYDIDWFVEVQRPENVEYRVGNFFMDNNILTSPLIMFDVDHSGKVEREFYNFLTTNNYKGTVVFDDIHLNEEMSKFWNDIKEEKYDLTDFNHWSGTGIVYF